MALRVTLWPLESRYGRQSHVMAHHVMASARLWPLESRYCRYGPRAVGLHPITCIRDAVRPPLLRRSRPLRRRGVRVLGRAAFTQFRRGRRLGAAPFACHTIPPRPRPSSAGGGRPYGGGGQGRAARGDGWSQVGG